MKKYKISIAFIWAVVAALFFASPAFSQDDLNYDPDANSSVSDDDGGTTKTYSSTDNYDDENYEYDEEDYDYEYSSRIKRFHRRTVVYDYYDPFFTDLYFYDPFFAPGASIYVGGYNDYYRWRRWNRWHRYNAWGWNDPFWGCGYNSWGWNRGWGWGNSWGYNPYVYNNFYYDPYWTWNGYNPYHCHSNVWQNNNYYYNNSNGGGNGGYQPQTYYGPRRGGSSINPGYAALPGNSRLKSDRVPADFERTGKTGRTVAHDNEPEPAAARSGRGETGRNPNEAQPNTRQPEVSERPSPRNEDFKPAERPAERLSRSESARDENRNSRRNEANSEPARPSRNESARDNDSRPSRSGWDTRSNDNESRPSRRSSSDDSRPSRSERNSESRPSRSERSFPSMDRGSSPSRGNSGGSKPSGRSRG